MTQLAHILTISRRPAVECIWRERHLRPQDHTIEWISEVSAGKRKVLPFKSKKDTKIDEYVCSGKAPVVLKCDDRKDSPTTRNLTATAQSMAWA
jgi:hypothetical protein